jgi:RNA polymerase sigma-70 factor (ECF subfamily)
MDDTAIVQLFWERSEQAIKEVAKKYSHFCMSIARNILGNPEDAEECVNDAYLSLWNAIPPKKPAVLPPFLGRITRNLALNRYKKNHAAKRGSGEFAIVLDELSEVIAGQETADSELYQEELLAAVNGFLTSLPPEKRKIFVCRYWYAESVKDIARRMNMTENNVSVTLNRLKNQLRTLLLEGGLLS